MRVIQLNNLHRICLTHDTILFIHVSGTRYPMLTTSFCERVHNSNRKTYIVYHVYSHDVNPYAKQTKYAHKCFYGFYSEHCTIITSQIKIKSEHNEILFVLDDTTKNSTEIMRQLNRYVRRDVFTNDGNHKAQLGIV